MDPDILAEMTGITIPVIFNGVRYVVNSTCNHLGETVFDVKCAYEDKTERAVSPAEKEEVIDFLKKSYRC